MRSGDERTRATKCATVLPARLVLSSHRNLPDVQALQGISEDDPNIDEMQRHMVEAVRQAGLLPRGAWPPEPPAEVPLPEEVVVPEPDASMVAHLGDMGFSAAAARRALLLSAGQMNTAVNYLVAHSGDGSSEAEPTMEELQCVLPCVCMSQLARLGSSLQA
jgi:uncharacterized UBP type Zn finger protein